jgi:hypothetical protein
VEVRPNFPFDLGPSDLRPIGLCLIGFLKRAPSLNEGLYTKVKHLISPVPLNWGPVPFSVSNKKLGPCQVEDSRQVDPLP